MSAAMPAATTAPAAAAPKHTAGPWHIKGGEIFSSEDILGVVYRTEAWTTGDPVEYEDQANAALISAAPDLLAAGRKMAAALVRCDDLFSDIRGDFSDPRSECREGWAVIAEALAEWNAALAKALGA